MKILLFIKRNYSEQNLIRKICIWICVLMVGVIIASKFMLFKELYNSYFPALYKNVLNTIIDKLYFQDIIFLLFFIIIAMLLLTTGNKMDLEKARVCYTLINNEDLELENIEIRNRGEVEYIYDRSEFNNNELDWQKKYINNRVLINAIITTKSKEYIITKMKISWKYVRGNQCALSTCEAIEPVLKWYATIDIDTKDTSLKEKIINLNPALVIRPNESFFGIGNFEVELFYKLTNTEFHPCANWDILYSITLIDHKDKEFNLITNRNWRNIPASDIMI